jgi:predicted SprT family Zn-dependent metalloprotease
MSPDDVTNRNYERLATAYDWFNRHLFAGALPPCLITFQRSRTARGYYRHDAAKLRRGKRRTPEIALNPDAFPGRSDGGVMSTLVHEMCHLWQAHFGKPGRRGYHNREWARKMEEVGLRPSHTGRPGGAKTGERVTHYVVRRGRFEEAWGELYRTGFRLEWETDYRPSADRSKARYTCPGCRTNVWGKPGLGGALRCVPCRRLFVVTD